MMRVDEEFLTYVTIEQRLLSAAGDLRRARARLEGPGMLTSQVQDALTALDRAVDLARWAKRVALQEWKDALDAGRAA
ncbi:MAG TPA: hypothetical protein VKZ50_02205 [bacterium]|nr:hypothetical protein [bacterium]